MHLSLDIRLSYRKNISVHTSAHVYLCLCYSASIIKKKYFHTDGLNVIIHIKMCSQNNIIFNYHIKNQMIINNIIINDDSTFLSHNEFYDFGIKHISLFNYLDKSFLVIQINLWSLCSGTKISRNYFNLVLTLLLCSHCVNLVVGFMT